MSQLLQIPAETEKEALNAGQRKQTRHTLERITSLPSVWQSANPSDISESPTNAPGSPGESARRSIHGEDSLKITNLRDAAVRGLTNTPIETRLRRDTLPCVIGSDDESEIRRQEALFKYRNARELRIRQTFDQLPEKTNSEPVEHVVEHPIQRTVELNVDHPPVVACPEAAATEFLQPAKLGPQSSSEISSHTEDIGEIEEIDEMDAETLLQLEREFLSRRMKQDLGSSEDVANRKSERTSNGTAQKDHDDDDDHKEDNNDSNSSKNENPKSKNEEKEISDQNRNISDENTLAVGSEETLTTTRENGETSNQIEEEMTEEELRKLELEFLHRHKRVASSDDESEMNNQTASSEEQKREEVLPQEHQEQTAIERTATPETPAAASATQQGSQKDSVDTTNNESKHIDGLHNVKIDEPIPLPPVKEVTAEREVYLKKEDSFDVDEEDLRMMEHDFIQRQRGITAQESSLSAQGKEKGHDEDEDKAIMRRRIVEKRLNHHLSPESSGDESSSAIEPDIERPSRKSTIKDEEEEEEDGVSFSDLIEAAQSGPDTMGKQVGDYQLGNMLGHGAFGRVYKGLNLKTGQFVAVKELTLTDKEFVDNELPRVLSEIQILRNLNHPNIVQYYEFAIQANSMYIILEFIENGSLADTIKKFGHFPESLTAMYIDQVLSGLAYLHEIHIIHRDIKGANILITKDSVCKLADFGVATQIEPGVNSYSAVGTPYWMAPEIFEMKSITDATDIWSLGCTVLELVTGHPPYHGMGAMNAMYHILEDPHPPIPQNASEELRDFLLCCFAKDPTKRKTAKELQDHPWIIKHRKQSHRNQTFDDAKKEIMFTNRNVQMDSSAYSVRPGDVASFMSVYEERDQNDVASILSRRKRSKSMERKGEEVDINNMALPELKAYCRELQQEANEFLEVINRMDTRHRKNLKELSTNWETAEKEVLSMRKANWQLTEILELIEKEFLRTEEMKLARLLYHTLDMNAPIHAGGTKGVLFVRRADRVSSKWHKRWVLLHDNFLFLYKQEDPSAPIDCMRIYQLSLEPSLTKVAGRKNSFKITSGQKKLFLCAASQSIMAKWMNALSNCRNWFENITYNAKIIVDAEVSNTPVVEKKEEYKPEKEVKPKFISVGKDAEVLPRRMLETPVTRLMKGNKNSLSSSSFFSNEKSLGVACSLPVEASSHQRSGDLIGPTASEIQSIAKSNIVDCSGSSMESSPFVTDEQGYSGSEDEEEDIHEEKPKAAVRFAPVATISKEKEREKEKEKDKPMVKFSTISPRTLQVHGGSDDSLLAARHELVGRHDIFSEMHSYEPDKISGHSMSAMDEACSSAPIRSVSSGSSSTPILKAEEPSHSSDFSSPSGSAPHPPPIPTTKHRFIPAYPIPPTPPCKLQPQMSEDNLNHDASKLKPLQHLPPPRMITPQLNREEISVITNSSRRNKALVSAKKTEGKPEDAPLVSPTTRSRRPSAPPVVASSIHHSGSVPAADSTSFPPPVFLQNPINNNLVASNSVSSEENDHSEDEDPTSIANVGSPFPGVRHHELDNNKRALASGKIKKYLDMRLEKKVKKGQDKR